MITDFFKCENPKVKKYDYFEYHPGFIQERLFSKVHKEIKPHLQNNSSRKSCVCVDPDSKKNNFIQYSLPQISWDECPTITQIKKNIMDNHFQNQLDYGLVHLYENEKSVINWHSDKEATKSYIYSISLGEPRKFALREIETNKIISFTLLNGDLFIMKPGCQEKYEHCIKSSKMFDKPRISITFRQIETEGCFFTLNPKNNQVKTSSELLENTNIITHVKHSVFICLEDDNFECGEEITTKSNYTPLLKSNLQKAIRRNEKQVALDTTAYMIKNNMILDLLRRLTIIAFEDVTVDSYYTVIVWYYTVVSNQPNIKLKYEDLRFIYSYVGLLCDIEVNYDYDVSKIDLPDIKLNEITNDEYCVSLYIRKMYGGFSGEINIMNQLIKNIKDGKFEIEKREIEILDFDVDKIIIPKILDCAIDFHCYPGMIKRVSEHIGDENKLSEDKIKNLIWTFDSSINYRKKPKKNKDDKKLWKEIVKPSCKGYRRFLKDKITL